MEKISQILGKISLLYTSYYICKVSLKETFIFFFLYLRFVVLALHLP